MQENIQSPGTKEHQESLSGYKLHRKKRKKKRGIINWKQHYKAKQIQLRCKTKSDLLNIYLAGKVEEIQLHENHLIHIDHPQPPKSGKEIIFDVSSYQIEPNLDIINIKSKLITVKRNMIYKSQQSTDMKKL